jgi:hypothetical protein
MADDDNVKIQANDGTIFEVLVGEARMSVTLKSLIEGYLKCLIEFIEFKTC